MSSPKQEISLQVTVHIAPENVPKFFELIKPIYEKVIAEPECTFFEVYQSQEESGTLSWVENWTVSKEWLFQNQFVKDYYNEYFATTEPMFIKPREIKFVNVVGPEFSYKSANV